MFRLTLLLFMVNYIASNKIMCPFVPKGDDGHCPMVFEEFQRLCKDQPLEDMDLVKIKEFRAQVICDHVDSNEFTELIASLKTGFQEEAFKNSEHVQNVLRRDMKIRLSSHIEEEVKAEVDNLRERSLAKIENSKSWLTNMEQGYLKTLNRIVQRYFGKTTMATSPQINYPSVPTTYKKLPFTSYHPTWDGFSLSNHFMTSSPALLRKFEFHNDKWIVNNSRTPSYETWHTAKPDRAVEVSYRGPYQFYVAYFTTPPMMSDNEVPLHWILAVTYTNCWANAANWKWNTFSYLNVKFSVNEKGWVILTYDSTHHMDATIPDPLQDDGTGEGTVVAIKGLNSTARGSDCANEIPGPGIYRMFKNGTCTGMAIFSKKSAQLDKLCSDSVIPGADVSYMIAVLYIRTSVVSTSPSHTTTEFLVTKTGAYKGDSEENPNVRDSDVTSAEPAMFWSIGKEPLSYDLARARKKTRSG